MVLDCFSKKAMWCKMRRGLYTALIDAKLANIGGLGQNRVLKLVHRQARDRAGN